MPEFLKYGAAVVAVGLYVWVITILLEDNNWVGISALTTMLLAIAAFWTIKAADTREERRRKDEIEKEKRERKERLLNEIIDWAVDVGKCGSDISILFSPEAVGLSIDSVTEYEHQKITEAMTQTHLGTLLLRYKAIVARREYARTAISAFGGNLSTKEKEVSDELNKFLPVLDRRIKGNATDEDVRKAEEELNESARILIEEATKIKTRDIGKEEENMSKEVKATGSKEPTLKSIEDHLKHQDIQMKKGNYLTGAAVGASIILVAVTLWVGRTVLSTDAFYWTYIFLVAIGFGFMSWCRYKQRKVK